MKSVVDNNAVEKQLSPKFGEQEQKAAEQL